MKIKITSNPITPYGDFSRGQELTDEKYPASFLIHLVEQANAAEYMDKEAYKTKVVEVEAVKKTPSSPLSQQGKASDKKTSTSRKKKRKS